MSTAYYPQGMRTMPAGGRNSATLPSQYKSWKGDGTFSNPVGSVPTHVRPLTNNDSGNVFMSGSFPKEVFGKGRRFIPRPIKHYRKGRIIPSQEIQPSDPSSSVSVQEANLINYNMNRFVSSAKGQSLLGGSGSNGGLVGDMIDKPGSFIVFQNSPSEVTNTEELDKSCRKCESIGVVSSYYPNNSYLTNNPTASTQSKILCCNEEYKAKRRAIYASTNIKKNYYTTNAEYLKNRCKTFDQKSFNFKDARPLDPNYNGSLGDTTGAKPGSALALTNTYVANCYPNAEVFDSTERALVARLLYILLAKGILTNADIENFNELINSTTEVPTFKALFGFLNTLSTEVKEKSLQEFTSFINNPYWGVPFAGPSKYNGCKLTVYKPNNPQFAKQGAVDSSTRNLKLMVNTISTNAAAIRSSKYGKNYYQNWGGNLVNTNEINRGTDAILINLYNMKSQQSCTINPALINGKYPYQNKKSCVYTDLRKYSLPISKPFSKRDYISTYKSSNHYCQNPRTYQNPSSN